MRRALLAAFLLATIAAAPADAAGLRAGAGRADLTPPTGYYMMGWVHVDALARGAHTRLYARALVLERDGRKVALVAIDSGAVAGGAIKHAADLLKDRGFSEANVLVSASHTHSSPTGWFNFSSYNTVFMTKTSPTEHNVTGERDQALYAFMVRRIAEAIRRADEDLAPAAAAWGHTKLTGITENRSLEAHLHNHGIVKEFQEGRLSDDPQGYEETINPNVDVLRVDKVRGRRRIPIGVWSNFANHGTVVKASFDHYSGDHHASATRVVEDTLRRRGKVPARQEVVNVYGNADEGDMSSGLHRGGPAEADAIGRAEADAFLRAWRSAGRRMSRTPVFDYRWTRVCFCGQEVEGGRVDSRGVLGLPMFTGSEENRGPLHEVTGVPFEGYHGPDDGGPQGNKLQIIDPSPPRAVPQMVVRVGDTVIGSVPGEMTVAMGARVREAIRDAAGARRAVLSGLANEFIQYFVTPEEYDRQHYEGGSTLFGRLASNLVKGTLSDLGRRMARGEPAPPAYEFDPTNGVPRDGPAFDAGADRGIVLDQPSPTERLALATFAWQGGVRGFDRPLDRPFITIERRSRGRWRHYADDLGMQLIWRVDENGRYDASWQIPHTAPAGDYRFRVTANRYSLASKRFAVRPSHRLAIAGVARDARGPVVELRYPAASENLDLTWRPRRAQGGRIQYAGDGRRRSVRRVKGERFPLRGSRVTIRPGAARDRWGNTNREAATLAP